MTSGHLELPAGTYCGRLHERRTSAGIGLSEWSYPPGARLERHEHPLSGFCVVLRGGYHEAFRTRTRECGAGDLVFHPPGEVHSDRHFEGVVRLLCVLLCVEISAERGDALRAEGHLLDAPVEFRRGAPTWLAARLAQEFREGDRHAALALEGLTLEMVALTARRVHRSPEPGNAPPWLRRAREFLRDGDAPKGGMEGIAREVGVHPVHLARAFRKHYGCAPADFARGIRVEEARRRLAKTDDALGTIALEAGFADQSHLTRAFRARTGLTPGAYRRALGRKA